MCLKIKIRRIRKIKIRRKATIYSTVQIKKNPIIGWTTSKHHVYSVVLCLYLLIQETEYCHEFAYSGQK